MKLTTAAVFLSIVFTSCYTAEAFAESAQVRYLDKVKEVGNGENSWRAPTCNDNMCLAATASTSNAEGYTISFNSEEDSFVLDKFSVKLKEKTRATALGYSVYSPHAGTFVTSPNTVVNKDKGRNRVVLKFDGSTDEASVSYVGAGLTMYNDQFWLSPTTAPQVYKNKVFMCPANTQLQYTTTKVVAYDVEDPSKTYRLIGKDMKELIDEEDLKKFATTQIQLFASSQVIGHKMYCIPYDANRVLVVDMEEETVNFIGDSLGSFKSTLYKHAFLSKDKIYAVPYSTNPNSNVLEIHQDGNDDVITLIDAGAPDAEYNDVGLIIKDCVGIYDDKIYCMGNYNNVYNQKLYYYNVIQHHWDKVKVPCFFIPGEVMNGKLYNLPSYLHGFRFASFDLRSRTFNMQENAFTNTFMNKVCGGKANLCGHPFSGMVRLDGKLILSPRFAERPAILEHFCKPGSFLDQSTNMFLCKPCPDGKTTLQWDQLECVTEENQKSQEQIPRCPTCTHEKGHIAVTHFSTHPKYHVARTHSCLVSDNTCTCTCESVVPSN